VAKGKKKDKDESIVSKAIAIVDEPKGKAKGKKKDKKAEGGKKAEGKKSFDALSRLVDHPLVSELLAVGAIAAVGVIAEHRKLGEVEAKSAKAVKSAGKAAASAIGVRLMKEFSFGSGAKKSPDKQV
jgi:hypothetical protein